MEEEKLQSDGVFFTLHLNLADEFSKAYTRKPRRHHKHSKLNIDNYKEIKQEADVNKEYESDASEYTSGRA